MKYPQLQNTQNKTERTVRSMVSPWQMTLEDYA